MAKVFIDGSAGTTGLRIFERLGGRRDIELVKIREELRKDAGARREALNSCDAAFLCLPDDAAREAVAMVENPDVVIFDTSTAHRTSEGWVYGFPELGREQFEAVESSKRIAVPGCHASGFVALVRPLVEAGMISTDAKLVCHSLTGYSGGGKKMIAEYEAEGRDQLLDAPRQYGLGQKHKHLAEMKAVCGLENAPVFCPIVAPFYSGMEVTVALFSDMLSGGAGIEELKALYREKYGSRLVRYTDEEENGFMSAAYLSGKDSMAITVTGNEERMLLIARFDNLGKGASGAAIECLNIVLGLPPETGLEI